MGLFKEKFCYKCGAKIGLLSGKSGKDYYICSNCLKKYSADSYVRMGMLKDIQTMEEMNRYLVYCEQNQEELREFKKTKSFYDCIQIDEYAEKVVIINNLDFEKKGKLLEINPPVYDLDAFLFFHVINKDISDKKGIMSKYIRLKQKIMLGFDSEWFPVACNYTVNVDMPIKQGIFKDTVYMSTEANDMAEYLISNASDEYKEMILQLSSQQYELPGELTNIQKKYFGQLQNMKSYVMSSPEMADYLKNTVANKVNRKRISREYNL